MSFIISLLLLETIHCSCLSFYTLTLLKTIHCNLYYILLDLPRISQKLQMKLISKCFCSGLFLCFLESHQTMRFFFPIFYPCSLNSYLLQVIPSQLSSHVFIGLCSGFVSRICASFKFILFFQTWTFTYKNQYIALLIIMNKHFYSMTFLSFQNTMFQETCFIYS